MYNILDYDILVFLPFLWENMGYVLSQKWKKMAKKLP